MLVCPTNCGEAMNNIWKQLQEDIRRYRIVRRDLFCRGWDESLCVRFNRRLAAHRSLHIIEHATGMALITRRHESMISTRATATHASIHTFCKSGPFERRLLTADDFRAFFPTLSRPGLPRGYYVDLSQTQPVLGFVRVEATPAPLRRIQARFSDWIRRHQQHPVFNGLICNHQFEISLLVPTASKADAINSTPLNRQCPDVTCEAVAMPLLMDLLIPR